MTLIANDAQDPAEAEMDATSPSSGWQNWSGSLPPGTAPIVAPQDMAQLKAVLADTKGPVRPVGSGHSWMPLVPADGMSANSASHSGTYSDSGAVVRLDAFGGVVSVDAPNQCARLGAGGQLKHLSPLLAAHGLAFRNLGDIDVQSLAGATSTATHGTGKTLPCLAAEIQGLTLLTANGDTLRIDATENAALLPAAQVALGALGIITQMDMQLVACYKLHRRVQFRPIGEVLGAAMDLWETHRNFEFFYIPFSGTAMSITHDITDAADTPRDEDESDDAVMQLKALRDKLGWFPWARKKLLGAAISKAPEENVIGDSWQLLSSARNVAFNEMEYHLPVENGLAALDEVRHYIERHRPDVFFPLECRMTAADNAWLSPFHAGPCISVAVHTHAPDAYDFLFSDIEPILRRHGGRPHWGKLNSLDGVDLAALYPKLADFAKLRRELDPQGRFLNRYLHGLFETA